MTKNLKNYLDPRGVRVLERRLASGDISPQVFKEILRRQMIKQYFQNRPDPIQRLKNKVLQCWRPVSREPLPSGKPEIEGFPLVEMEELFALRQKKYITPLDG